jgi:hypothetical protein
MIVNGGRSVDKSGSPAQGTGRHEIYPAAVLTGSAEQSTGGMPEMGIATRAERSAKIVTGDGA